MKNFYRIIFNYLLVILIFLFGSYSLVRTYNYYHSNYEIKFSSTSEFNYKLLEDKDYLLSIRSIDEKKYGHIDVEKMVKENDVKVIKDGNDYLITTGYEYYQTFFLSSSKKESSRVKTFYKLAVENLNIDYNFSYHDIYIVNKALNEGLIITLGTFLGVAVYSIIFAFDLKKEQMVYDNKETFFTPFHLNYLKKATSFFKKTKNIVTIAMIFSLMMVSKMFVIPSGFAILGISFTYLFFALLCTMYGPFLGLIIGFFSDILGFFLFQQGGTVFYFGYTLQAMLAGFTYGIFLYKTKISFSRVFLSRLVVNMFLNVYLGSIFFGDVMEYSKDVTMAYMLIISLPKNLLYLIPQSICLYLFLKALGPVLYRFGFINKNILKNISLT